VREVKREARPLLLMERREPEGGEKERKGGRKGGREEYVPRG